MEGYLSFCARAIEHAASRSKIGTRTIRRASALIFWTVVAAPSWAQVTIPQEYGKHVTSAEVVGALGTNLFGDQTNFYTGATEFVVTDVSLPGNNALPVAVGRRFSVESREAFAAKNKGMFGDWDLEIPHLHGIFEASRPWQSRALTIISRWQEATRGQGVLCFDMFARPTSVARSSVTAP